MGYWCELSEESSYLYLYWGIEAGHWWTDTTKLLAALLWAQDWGDAHPQVSSLALFWIRSTGYSQQVLELSLVVRHSRFTIDGNSSHQWAIVLVCEKLAGAAAGAPAPKIALGYLQLPADICRWQRIVRHAPVPGVYKHYLLLFSPFLSRWGGQYSKIRSLWVGTSLWMEMRQRWELTGMLKTSVGMLLILPWYYPVCGSARSPHAFMTTSVLMQSWRPDRARWSHGPGDKSPSHAAPQGTGVSLLCSWGHWAALGVSSLELTHGLMAVVKTRTFHHVCISYLCL